MSKYTVRPATMDDLQAIAKNSFETPLWATLDGRQMAALLDEPTYAGFYEDQLLVVGGFVKLWPGLAEAWIAVAPEALNHKFFVIRETRLFIKLMTQHLHLHRLQSTVQASFTTARRFAEAMGFDEPQVTLRKYGIHGEDFILYAKVM